MERLVKAVDRELIPLLRRWSIPLLRYSLAIVFVWFGSLKVLGVSPVEPLVEATVYWVDSGWLVPALGCVEILIGVCLGLGKLIRFAILMVACQLTGTFLVFVVLPDVTFQGGNPLLLTTEGEFILKNLVLLSAALVVGGGLSPGEGLGRERFGDAAGVG